VLETLNPLVKNIMKRLSLEELKAQKGNVAPNLEAISGGSLDDCHGLTPAEIEAERKRHDSF
jgi:hypothetical protein